LDLSEFPEELALRDQRRDRLEAKEFGHFPHFPLVGYRSWVGVLSHHETPKLAGTTRGPMRWTPAQPAVRMTRHDLPSTVNYWHYWYY
jgi:hypothetical protein